MAETTAVTNIFKFLARFARAHPLAQLVTAAALWTPLCVGLALILEWSGYSYPVEYVTGGWGVRIMAAGLAGLLGFWLVSIRVRQKRRGFRSNRETAAAKRVESKAAATQAELDSRLAAASQRLQEAEGAIGLMDDSMRNVLRRFVDERRKYIDYPKHRSPEASVSQLEALGWVTAHISSETTSAWVDEEVFTFLLAHPELVGSTAAATKPRASLRGP